MMVLFIDEHCGVREVESICEVLPIAAATYYDHKAKQRPPTLRSARVKRDEQLVV